jgi:hypothetical protein
MKVRRSRLGKRNIAGLFSNNSNPRNCFGIATDCVIVDMIEACLVAAALDGGKEFFDFTGG